MIDLLKDQWAALDRLKDDIFKMPTEDEHEDAFRVRFVAMLLMDVWSARLSGLNADDQGLAQPINVEVAGAAEASQQLREEEGPSGWNEVNAETYLALTTRGTRLCWEATAPGMPLSCESLVLGGGGPWDAALRREIRSTLAEIEEVDESHIFFHFLLLPLSDQMLIRGQLREE